jgi:hypothetical protein
VTQSLGAQQARFPGRCPADCGTSGGPAVNRLLDQQLEPRQSECDAHAALFAWFSSDPGWLMSGTHDAAQTTGLARGSRFHGASSCTFSLPNPASLTCLAFRTPRANMSRPQDVSVAHAAPSRAFRLEPVEPPSCCCGRLKSRRRYSWASSS